MSQPPFRMDPSAKFDDEIARLAAEHDADVTFRLVEREEQPMDSYCWVHDRDRPGEASHVATIDGPGPGTTQKSAFATSTPWRCMTTITTTLPKMPDQGGRQTSKRQTRTRT